MIDEVETVVSSKLLKNKSRLDRNLKNSSINFISLFAGGVRRKAEASRGSPVHNLHHVQFRAEHLGSLERSHRSVQGAC